ncbi:MAG TPA: DUF2085 domain-containing protein [Pyrinomonadaceae bacterium]|nr:DUF2085 domain-containing protein [Pyrinomonadaceae bacterium]
MPEAIENYTPQTTLKDIKRLAFLAWAIGFAFVFIWVAAIVFAPIFETNGLANISAPIYKFFSFLCHQQSSRSFHFHEHQFAVCSRCFGIYFGLLAGFIVYLFIKKIEDIEPIPRFWLFLALIPMGIDWGLTAFDIWENTHLSRLLTGLILGITCAIFIVPALVEIVRLLSKKSKRQSSKQLNF